MKRVLVANIFGIGDVLFTTPLLASLKKEVEGVSIDYICNARTKAVLESNPDVDSIFVYEKDDLADLWQRSKKSFFSALSGLFGGIRGSRYDAVFDFTLSRKFGLAFALAGIPKRIGLDYKNRGVFLTHKRKLEGFEGKHVVEYYLDLLDDAGVRPAVRETQIVLDESSQNWAEEYLRNRGINKDRVVAVIPGGGASWGPDASRKRWRPDGFARVADALTERSVQVMVLGDGAEEDLCCEVRDNMAKKPALVENGLALKEYIALLSMCGLVVCNDGGPLHIAVALGARTVSVFGPVDEKVYGPYPPNDRNRVVSGDEEDCRPCYSRFRLPECDRDIRCLSGISPGVVIENCLELLEKDA